MDNIYKAILEDALAGFWDWNIKDKTIYLSPAYKAMFGYTDDELPNTVDVWTDLVHPADLHIITQSMERHIKSKGAIEHSGEVRFRHKNGSFIWVLCSGRVIEWDGKIAVRMAGCHIDIDIQRKAQQALQISEERFRGAFEYSAIGMALVSPKGEWLKVNKKLRQMVGYTSKELFKLTFQDITHPDDLDKDLVLLEKLVANEIESYQLEKRYFHKNGNIIWALLSVSLVRDEMGRPLHFVSQIEDVTQRKNAESKLKETQEQYRKLYKSVQDVFFRIDVNGLIADISPSIEKYDGYKWEQFLGQPAEVFYQNPADRQSVLDALTTYGKINDFDVRLKTPDGSFVYTSINAYVIYDEKGQYAGSEGSIRDITERVKAEHALKERDALLTKLSQQIPGVIYQFQCDEDGHSYFPFVSNEVNELYELDAKDIRYDSGQVFERVHPDDIEGFRSSIMGSFISLNMWKHEFRVILPKKGLRWLRGLSRPEKQADGSVIWHGFVADVTEKKLEEQQLQSTFDLITEQNNRLVNFAYIISHNLRTHSGNFEMLVDLLAESHDESEKADFIRHLKRVSDLLSETIMHLNEVVSIQTSIDKQMSKINVFEYVEKAIEVLTINENPAKLTIDNWVPPDLEFEYSAAYIESIIFNFLSNAIKYGYPGRKTEITIIAYFEDERPVLEFIDNGLGIDMKRNRDKLFGMYRTFHDNPDSKGIGLFITKSQVEAMGGYIDVTSEVGKGSRFKVVLA